MNDANYQDLATYMSVCTYNYNCPLDVDCVSYMRFVSEVSANAGEYVSNMNFLICKDIAGRNKHTNAHTHTHSLVRHLSLSRGHTLS